MAIPYKVKYKSTEFQPYIYTDSEIARYFEAVDTYENDKSPKDAIQYPILFRILYCCGARIGEILAVRKKNVDIRNGIIELQDTKNGDSRYIVLNDELLRLMRRNADRCFYLYKDDDFIFTDPKGKPLDERRIHERHMEFLFDAGIPFYGEGKGPRVHDWRHTFAVKAFKKMSDEGADLYASLPVLSVYLGHKTILATEHYLRITAEIYPEIRNKLENVMNFVLGGPDYEVD